MKEWPEFNEHGDLPVGVHQATLAEVIEHFGRSYLELKAMVERINRLQQQGIHMRKAQKDPLTYKLSAGGFLAEIGRMNLEVREYLIFPPSEVQDEELLPTGTRLIERSGDTRRL